MKGLPPVRLRSLCLLTFAQACLTDPVLFLAGRCQPCLALPFPQTFFRATLFSTFNQRC